MSARPAAFFRVEGPVLSRSAKLAAAWLAANSQEISSRFARLGAVALSAPLALGGDRTLATRAAWMGLRGMTEDRLVILGEDYYEAYLEDNLQAVGLDLLARAKREKQQIVLVSEHLECIIAPLAKKVGAAHLVCNRMEFRNGRATGRLLDPVVGRLGGTWLKNFAAQHNLDLSKSTAYGATDADVALLSAVALPCAVRPDRAMRAAARDLDWPVVGA